MRVAPTSDRSTEVEALREELAALSARLARVEARMWTLGAASAPATTGDATTPSSALSSATAAGLSGAATLTGRLLLVLAGAYLLRAVTGEGRLPLALGVGLALVYAGIWLAAAHRAGGRSRPASAVVHGLGAALVAFPLVAEVSTRFDLWPPEVAAGVLGAVAFAGLLVALRHDLAALAWIFGAGATGVGAWLLLRPGGALPFGTFFVLLGAAAAVSARRRGWLLAEWPSALTADAAALFLTSAALAVGSPPPLVAVLPVLLALPTFYVGFSLHGLVRRGRAIAAFDVIQPALALAVGYGGALALAGETAGLRPVVGGLGLVLGLLAYAAAFFRTARTSRAPFLYLTTLGLALVVVGSAFAVPRPAIPFAVLGAMAAWAGHRYGRVMPLVHGAVLSAVACVSSGLLTSALEGLAGSLDSAWTAPPADAWLALAGAVFIAALPRPDDALARRLLPSTPQFTAVLLCGIGGGGALLHGLVPAIAGTPGASADAAVAATVRTGLLAMAAFACAFLARVPRREPTARVVPVLLALGLVKLLLEDLPRGVPATQGLSFFLYGLALLAAPRIARRRQAAATLAPPPPPPPPPPPTPPTTLAATV